MPLSRAQAEDFVERFCRVFRVPQPRIDARQVLRFQSRYRRMHLGRKITRTALANQLAGWMAARIDRQFPTGKRIRTDGRSYRQWKRYVGLMIAATFGPGEGV